MKFRRFETTMRPVLDNMELIERDNFLTTFKYWSQRQFSSLQNCRTMISPRSCSR